MSYRSQNRATIKRAFSRFQRNTDDVISRGMVNIARAGLLFLADAHEMFHIGDEHSHINEENTLAWAVAHNGNIVESGNYSGGGDDMPGDAEAEAANLLKGTTGWVAVIYSDMKGWYRSDWEEQYLGYSRGMVASDFYSIFKHIG